MLAAVQYARLVVGHDLVEDHVGHRLRLQRVGPGPAREPIRGRRGILDGLSRQFERALITKALERTGGRRIEAASLLGMGRNTITRKIQELGIDDDKSGSDHD